MKILIACEFSGIVREAFKMRGHDAWSCDILPSEIPGKHLLGDVTYVLNREWDLMIAHPPCTYLSNAGARYLYPNKKLNEERYELGLKAKDFFMMLLNAPIKRVCVENPLPSKIYELPKESQVIQPYQFGHPLSKRTHLWLKGLPELKHTKIINDHTPLIRSNVTAHKRNGKKQMGKYSGGFVTAKTFQGIADAMAEQWGSL